MRRNARNILAGAITAAIGLSTSAAEASGITVGIDTSRPVHLSRAAASVVVGNPSIADVYVQNGKLVFLQGRSFGTTNLVALDGQGAEIMNIPVTVTSPHGGATVTLQRGAAGRITYACSGRCEPTVMPGDQFDFTKSLADSVNTKASAADQAASAGTKAGR